MSSRPGMGGGQRGRYIALDVMRALAGLSVPVLHLLEGFRSGRETLYGGHIYFAVEFFMLLMGYMLGHAYDNRWGEKMGTGGFFLRRLKRLHPFVVTGLLLGLAVYAVQLAGGPVFFPWMKGATVGTIALAIVCSALMLPVPGISILAPFNACSWTLYYEYIGNLLYGLVLRRVGVKWLVALSVLGAAFTACWIFQVPVVGGRHGLSIAGGWSANVGHFHNGMVRLLFPLFFGLLLSRLKWRLTLPPTVAAIAVGVLFLALLFTPMTWFAGHDMAHRIFESAVVFAVLPAMLLVGVGNAPAVPQGVVGRATVYLAELSYPLYMSHYQLIEVHQWLVRAYFKDFSALAAFACSAAEYVLYIAIAAALLACYGTVAGKLKTKT